jgi:energy-coupling factor transporter ATP-binding protein EcfA2
MISLNRLDSETIGNIIIDLLNKDKGFHLKKYEGSLANKPDLVQIEKDPTRISIVCEIKGPRISDFDLFNSQFNKSESFINEYNPDQFILIVLKGLSIEDKDKLLLRFANNKSKVLILDLYYLNNLLEKYPEIGRKYLKVFNNWHESYSHIAELLNEYFIPSDDSPASTIFEVLEKTLYYEYNSKRIFQYEEGTNIKGLDPIQIFATFNYTRIKADKRVTNINLLLEALESNYRVDEKTNFSGCPTPIITQIIYNRKIDIQNQIWVAFNSIMKDGLDGLTELHYNNINNWYGIGIPSFTIFLFWIKSNIFMPLDQNTSTFIVGLRIIESIPNDYKSYKELCKKLHDKSLDLAANNNDLIRDIVKEAYNFVPNGTSNISSDSLVLELLKATKKKDNGVSIEEFEELSKHNFKLIGIRPHLNGEGNSQKHIKNLSENETYAFYNSYEIKDDDTIVQHSSANEYLYNVDDKRISISAIVGKNGSGKSTITELFYLIMNKLSVEKGFESDKELIDEPIFATLYFKTNNFYKITVGSDIQIWDYKYLKNENKFILNNQIVTSKEDLKAFDFNTLFYSIIINYSLFGLNSEHIGPWIESLFHKNDGYQIPVVLNPKRDKGIININEEEYLAKSRLLSNILEHNKNEIIADNLAAEILPGKVPSKLTLEIDEKKQLAKRAKYFQNKTTLSDSDKQEIEELIKLIPINNILANDCIEELKEYIYCKLISTKDYPQFSDYSEIYKDGRFNLTLFPAYINSIMTDSSHATFKVKQAINYLKFGLFKLGKENDVISSIKAINKTKGDEFQKETKSDKTQLLKTIELIPPSFFKFNISFESNLLTSVNSFNELSSGEKQQILSINTILYHLVNLDSVGDTKGLAKYNNVNIFFDEVELYFHPDMQRTYIHRLLSEIEKLELGSLKNINIVFVTHSPFILSDIPNHNILKLKEGTPEPFQEKEQTFGANIHDLLANDFFMSKSFMGAFAKSIVENIVEFTEGTKSKIKTADEAKKLINIIGEPLLKERLLFLLNKKVGEKTKDDIINELMEENKFLKEKSKL